MGPVPAGIHVGEIVGDHLQGLRSGSKSGAGCVVSAIHGCLAPARYQASQPPLSRAEKYSVSVEAAVVVPPRKLEKVSSTRHGRRSCRVAWPLTRQNLPACARETGQPYLRSPFPDTRRGRQDVFAVRQIYRQFPGGLYGLRISRAGALRRVEFRNRRPLVTSFTVKSVGLQQKSEELNIIEDSAFIVGELRRG